jgi:hypothetical protein
MLESPKRTIFSFPPWQAFTTDFFPPEISLRGTLHFIVFLFIATISFYEELCKHGMLMR